MKELLSYTELLILYTELFLSYTKKTNSYTNLLFFTWIILFLCTIIINLCKIIAGLCKKKLALCIKNLFLCILISPSYIQTLQWTLLFLITRPICLFLLPNLQCCYRKNHTYQRNNPKSDRYLTLMKPFLLIMMMQGTHQKHPSPFPILFLCIFKIADLNNYT